MKRLPAIALGTWYLRPIFDAAMKRNIYRFLCVIFFITYGMMEIEAQNTSDAHCHNISPEHTHILVRISEIEIYPQYIDEYLSLALEVGATSVREEPGVIAIYPMIQQRDSCQVRILEIYAHQEAYNHHIETKHFKTYKQGTLHMVKSLDLVDMTPMNPVAMPEIFLKMRNKKIKAHE